MLANLESSAVATGLEKISVQSNPKEGQCQRRFKCTIALILHFRKVMLKVLQARLQQYVNQELQMYKLGIEKAEESEIKLPTFIGSQIKQGNSKKTSTSVSLITLKPLTVDHNKLEKSEMGVPEHLTCFLRNLYVGQEATVRTRHEATNWFKIGERVRQDCILSPYLFNLYAEYLMGNAELDDP